MINLILMALGTYRFGIGRADYQQLTRFAEYRWEQLPRVGRRPASQYLGPGLETLTLDGTIYPHFKGGLRQVASMRLIAGTGVPLFMTDGLGFAWHRWCIVSVSETGSFLMADGAPRRIEFTVELQAYGADR